MKKSPLAIAVAATVLSGCATITPELVECLQPNRRVVVEIGGVKPKPPPKEKPGAKPGSQPVMLTALAQGNTAFDFESAALKDGGKEELDKVLKVVAEGAGKDKRPTNVGSIIITGHADRLEVAAGKEILGEERAKTVKDYLISKGANEKLIFWEGKGAKDPVPVTKFCES